MTNTAAPASLPAFIELDFHPTAVAMEAGRVTENHGTYYRLLDTFGNVVDVLGEAAVRRLLDVERAAGVRRAGQAGRTMQEVAADDAFLTLF